MQLYYLYNQTMFVVITHTHMHLYSISFTWQVSGHLVGIWVVQI